MTVTQINFKKSGSEMRLDAAALLGELQGHADEEKVTIRREPANVMSFRLRPRLVSCNNVRVRVANPSTCTLFDVSVCPAVMFGSLCVPMSRCALECDYVCRVCCVLRVV